MSNSIPFLPKAAFSDELLEVRVRFESVEEETVSVLLVRLKLCVSEELEIESHITSNRSIKSPRICSMLVGATRYSVNSVTSGA